MPTGRRLYSDEDVARLTLLRRATEAGLRIKDAATRTDDDLRTFLSEQAPHAPKTSAAQAARTAGDGATLLERCKEAVHALDGAALERVLARARVELSLPVLVEELAAPLVAWTGDEWSEGRVRIVEEHVMTAAMRTAMASYLRDAHVAGPSIVVTTPSGQVHELGALLAAISASAVGWRVEYLGPNLPANEIVLAVERTRSRAVALSLVFPPADPAVCEQLRDLRRQLAPEIPIFAGGRAAPTYAAVLEEIGARSFDTPTRFAKALSELPA
jgi:methanogenic corrinoid protein MtbC1